MCDRGVQFQLVFALAVSGEVRNTEDRIWIRVDGASHGGTNLDTCPQRPALLAGAYIPLTDLRF